MLCVVTQCWAHMDAFLNSVNCHIHCPKTRRKVHYYEQLCGKTLRTVPPIVTAHTFHS